MSLAHKGYYRNVFDEAAHLQVWGHSISPTDLTDVYLLTYVFFN